MNPPKVGGLFSHRIQHQQPHWAGVSPGAGSLCPGPVAPRVPEEVKAQREHNRRARRGAKAGGTCSGQRDGFPTTRGIVTAVTAFEGAVLGAVQSPSEVSPRPLQDCPSLCGPWWGEGGGCPALDSCSGPLVAMPGPQPPTPLSLVHSWRKTWRHALHRSMVSLPVPRGDLGVCGCWRAGRVNLHRAPLAPSAWPLGFCLF